MDEVPKSPVIVGQLARVEACGCSRSLLLTVGAVSLRLDMAAAADVAATLGHALRIFDPAAQWPIGAIGDN
jgi:hypothetical protein